MNNVLKDFLFINIGIHNIDAELLTVNKFSSNDKELFNLLAFSFINKTEKNKLFQSLTQKTLPMFLNNELFDFFQNHYRNIQIQYPLSDELIKEFITNLVDWIIIVDNNIDQRNIHKILTYVHTENIKFWICLIKELYSRKLYDLCLTILTKKKSKFKKNKLYEDLILYEIFTMKEFYDYLNNSSYRKKICTLSNEIKSYPVSKFFVQLECAFLNNDIVKFNNLFNLNIDLLNNFSVFDLLYIFEFTVLIKSEKVFNILDKRLLTFDIIEKQNKYEYSLYSFYKSIYNRDIMNSLNFIHRLVEEDYNFDHIIWFFKKNNYKNSFILLYIIEEKNKALNRKLLS